MNDLLQNKNSTLPPLVVLTGPTSVGKTKLSIELAKRINGEIISADSMQVYKGMDIGTAKITDDEKDGIKHHLIDVLNPNDSFNVTVFCKMANECILSIYDKGKIPIIVGGTGFYIQGLIYGIDFSDGDEDLSYRAELERLYDEKGADEVYKMLIEIDPDEAKILHKNDKRRIIRALEYYKTSKKRISEHNELSRNKDALYNFAYFVLNDDRAKLYERINERVDIMVKKGLFDEVKSLLDKGYLKDTTALQAIGYKEVIDYLDGNITKDDSINAIKQNTRHFAKRQITWFKREKDVIWLNKNEYEYDEESILRYIIKQLNERHIIKG